VRRRPRLLLLLGVGGTDEFGGVSAAGGGWVLSTNVNDVLDVCAFPTSRHRRLWPVLHSHGIIRGRSLKACCGFPTLIDRKSARGAGALKVAADAHRR